MNRGLTLLTIGAALVLLCIAPSSLAQAQSVPSPAAAIAPPILPRRPPLAKSVLGVPVVRPPIAAHRRKLAKPNAGAPVVELPGRPKAPSGPGVKAAAAKPATVRAAAATPAPPVAAVAAEAAKVDPAKGSVTGLPLPRWVAFRSDDVNLRSGPGTQYPIDWQYHRRNLPVQITREFEVWRLVVDPDGTKGWVHQATLTGRRGFLIKDLDRTLRGDANDTAMPVALLKAGVVGYIRNCPANSVWCEVQTGDYRGWLKRSEMYGVAADEVIN